MSASACTHSVASYSLSSAYSRGTQCRQIFPQKSVSVRFCETRNEAQIQGFNEQSSDIVMITFYSPASSGQHTPHATRRKFPSPCTPASHPVTPGGHGMVSSAAVRNLQRTAHALQCLVNGDDAAVFPVMSLVTLTFAFDLDIQTRPTERPSTSSV